MINAAGAMGYRFLVWFSHRFLVALGFVFAAVALDDFFFQGCAVFGTDVSIRCLGHHRNENEGWFVLVAAYLCSLMVSFATIFGAAFLRKRRASWGRLFSDALAYESGLMLVRVAVAASFWMFELLLPWWVWVSTYALLVGGVSYRWFWSLVDNPASGRQ